MLFILLQVWDKEKEIHFPKRKHTPEFVVVCTNALPLGHRELLGSQIDTKFKCDIFPV